MKQVVDEAEILKPKDPTLDEDEWDEIPLAGVDVYSAGTHEPANLLLADESAPVTVVGKLDRLLPLPAYHSRDLQCTALCLRPRR